MLIGEYEDAITVLEKAIIIHHRAELLYQLSNCYYNLKDDKKGRDVLQMALALEPSLAEDMLLKYPYIKDEVKKVKTKKK
jgi:tetratricopeptide (TPR) repeat protein